MTASWTGGAQSHFVEISGPGFVCTAGAGEGNFTLPAAVLANLPAQGTLNVGGVSQAVFTAPGLDAATVRYTQGSARTVNFGDPPFAATPVLLLNGRRILAEVAANDAERDRGLMQRAELPSDRGMLFVFDGPDFVPFWMYQTLIPLDIIWMDQNRRIVFISANTPPCASADPRLCPIYGGKESSQYVLEIGGGLAAPYGLRVGDRIDW